MSTQDYAYPTPAKFIHAGLAIFGITAYLTGEWAEDGVESLGYLLHSYLGLTLAAFILLRFYHGLTGPAAQRFSSWSPFSTKQWRLAMEDVRQLVQLKMPERGMHEGLAGLVHAFGLWLFAWMGFTGTGLFMLDGADNHIFEWVEEAHELGEALIPLFLLLHVGSVFVHSIAGRANWNKMWSFSRKTPDS